MRQPDFDSREVISDAARAELCTLALTLPLHKAASLHVLKSMEHWFSECTVDANRSLSETAATVIAVANNLTDSSCLLNPSARSAAIEILQAQTEKLELAAAQTANRHIAVDLIERMTAVHRAMAPLTL